VENLINVKSKNHGHKPVDQAPLWSNKNTRESQYQHISMLTSNQYIEATSFQNREQGKNLQFLQHSENLFLPE